MEPDVDAPPPPPPDPLEGCLIDWGGRRCFDGGEPDETPAESGTPGVPAITITDVVSFAPAPGAVIAEPGNLGVAGLPANFYTVARAHTATGALFGLPVAVRFTPLSFTFDYGDGGSRITEDGGRSWSALGLPPFSPTATSHVYAQRGTYAVRATTAYTAEVDLGLGWVSVSGRLTVASPPQEVRILEARTALVDRTCDEAPAASGC